MYGKVIIAYMVSMTVVFPVCRMEVLAQDPELSPEQDSLYQRILNMEKTIDEMTRLLQDKKQEDEMQKLLMEADRLSSGHQRKKWMFRRNFSAVSGNSRA